MKYWLLGVVLSTLLCFTHMEHVPSSESPSSNLRRSDDEEERPKLPTANELYPESESLTGLDRFSYGIFSLADGISGVFRKAEYNALSAVKFYEGILNFIHDTVHITNDTVDFHEAAYITGPTKAPDAAVRRRLLRLQTTKPPRI